MLYVCGSDEHGAAITLRARKDGVRPKQIVDRYHDLIEGSFKSLNFSFDIYHRTSSELHRETAADYFKDLEEKGAFTELTTEQYYDEQEKQFLADRYIQGSCPKCDNEKAYGDQCEQCGSALSPTELKNPKSTLSGSVPILKETTHWFLPMDQHEAWIKDWLDKGTLDGKTLHDPSSWKKHVLGQCRAWIDAGLRPRAMTRDLDWGVPVPLESGKNKVLYVWLDAPIGYISATKQWAKENNENWEDWWKGEDTNLVHFIGKDNIVFHCIIFPILLKLGNGFVLPTNVPANEFLNLEGEKISTSRNHAVWLHEYLEDFPEKKDELRYVLTSLMPEKKDSEFTWSDYQARVNNELVAILGNFINRAVVLVHKYFDGQVPSVSPDYIHPPSVLECIEQVESKVDTAIRSYKFREALQYAMEPARLGNKFLADTEPWRLIKTDEKAVAEILYSALCLTAICAKALDSFLPETATKIMAQLNLSKSLSIKDCTYLEVGQSIAKPSLLFKRVEDAEMDAQRAKLTKKESSTSNDKPMIQFDDFTKLDLRTGEILEAAKVDGADKLLQLKVSIGSETRQVVSGIAEHYAVDELVGKKVSLLLNLAPRKIRGVESQGMILMAEDSEGRLSFVSPEKEIEVGSVIR